MGRILQVFYNLKIAGVLVLGPVRSGTIEQMGQALNNRGNVATRHGYMSSVECIFAAGDMRHEQSLVMLAIAEGRKAAAAVDSNLTANSETLSLRHHSVI